MMTMMVVLASAAASDGSMTLGLILFGCAIGIIAFVVINNLDEKQTVRNSIRQLEEYGQTGAIETERDRELLRPAYERALAPVLGGMVNFGRRLFPTDYVARTKKKQQSAGRYDPAAVDRFLAFRVACLVIIPIAFFVFLVFNSFGLSMKMNVICFLLLTAAAILLPEARLDSAVEDRQREIQRSLPDILDLLVISVEAGLGFEQALDRTVASVPGALSLEFARMLGETRAGAARGRHACHGGTGQRPRGPLVRPRDHPGGHVRCVHRPRAPRPSRGDAHQAPPARPGTGAEGAGEDAHPDGLLHLPLAVRRRHRSGDHQHPEGVLEVMPRAVALHHELV